MKKNVIYMLADEFDKKYNLIRKKIQSFRTREKCNDSWGGAYFSLRRSIFQERKKKHWFHKYPQKILQVLLIYSSLFKKILDKKC